MTDPTAGLTRVARQPSAVLRVPVSTYRIQLGRTFTFTDLHDLVPYLADLGITDCYLSPFLLPCSDDSHGYDIADHNRFNSALGTEADFRACVDALRAHGLGVLADVVPNHMGISGSRNRWWLDLLEKLNGLFVDGAGRRVLDGTYARFVGTRTRFRELAYETRRLIIDSSMSSEINVLGHRLARMSEPQRSSRDFTGPSLVEALREVIASFPVYRTYVGEELDLVTDRDRRYIEQAVFAARRQNPTTNVSIFHFIRDLLCLRFPDWLSQAERLDRLHFVMKVQQLTGPVSAKGVEDTAFYQYNRLISLNEVGGDPELFGVAPDEFHQLNAGRGAGWPWALSATSTHDTKRSDDVRARLNVLSEIPAEWRARVRWWRRLNRRKKTAVDGAPAPDANEEYYLYQTLLGAWPLDPLSDGAAAHFAERLQQHMLKVLREAKVHESWTNPRPEYDEAMRRFLDALLDRAGDNPFLEDFLPFQRRVAQWGIYNSLSQTVLKLASPGVPDFYQRTELWDLSVVDPDNRRPVDFARRRELLQGLERDIAAAGEDLTTLAQDLVATKEEMVGENIAQTSDANQPVEAAMQGWMQSEGHRANILHRAFTRTGAGVCRAGSAYFFTQIFLRPGGA